MSEAVCIESARLRMSGARRSAVMHVMAEALRTCGKREKWGHLCFDFYNLIADSSRKLVRLVKNGSQTNIQFSIRRQMKRLIYSLNQVLLKKKAASIESTQYLLQVIFFDC